MLDAAVYRFSFQARRATLTALAQSGFQLPRGAWLRYGSEMVSLIAKGSRLGWPLQVAVAFVLAGTCSPARAQGAMQIEGSGRPTQTQPNGQTFEPPKDFVQKCSLCHGGDARGTDRGVNLVHDPNLVRLADSAVAEIIHKGRGGMPAFPLPAAELAALTRYLRVLNPVDTALASGPGDGALHRGGEALFFGSAGCSGCHTVQGRGGTNGPDLSEIGSRLRSADLAAALTDPDARIAPGYGTVTVTKNDGGKVHGFARVQHTHDLVLQTRDGTLVSLLDNEFTKVTPDIQSAMPPFDGTPDEQKQLVDYMGTLRGAGTGPLKGSSAKVGAHAFDRIAHPRAGEWPTYNGTLDGNRYSGLQEIDTKTVGRLRPAWMYTMQFNGLETTPLVSDGVMYVTGTNQVIALDARTGSEIWRYERPKSAASTISSDAAIGVNRGVALLGDRVFYLTDDAHLLALSRLTGTLIWDVYAPEETQRYGGTSAPLVVGDLVVTGVSGADDGIRGFVAAYKVTTGELAWRTWTVPKPGEPGSETWKGSALKLGGGSTWMSGSYDAATGVLFWAVGNPHPDTDGDERLGSNLYTNSDLALDPKTGKILWHYQFTPHDLHDWDANEPMVLIDTKWKGQPRKLLLHANRNGFLYVLDRQTGTPLLATQMVDRMTWASGIDQKTWTPILLPANETTAQGAVTCPAVRGATNWYSTAWSPETRLYYVMTVEDCGRYRKAEDGGFGRYNDPAHPAQKILRAFDIETGKATWQIVLPGNVQANYSGVLATAGGLVFFGENDGGFAAADAATGKALWHFSGNRPMKSSPMTYSIAGKQYVAIAAGAEIMTFALPDDAAGR